MKGFALSTGFGGGVAEMIDTFSILLAHALLAFVAVRMLRHPYLNQEPARSERHFKQVVPAMIRKRRAGVETGEARPGAKSHPHSPPD